MLEISAHGAPVILHSIVSAAIDAGARLARPGEFTLRAFLNGKRDLVQAEAVADLVAAATPLQARVAFDQLLGTLSRRIAEIDRALFDLIARLEASLDFPDEGYHFVEAGTAAAEIGAVLDAIDLLLADGRRGRMIREGATVVIAGRPNVGKSSIFNALAGADRAIVTEVPGTTRDMVTERIDIAGLAVTLVDTAGWRDTDDAVEREGVARGAQARDVADLLVLVLDGSAPLTGEDRHLLEATASRVRLIVMNKTDLDPEPSALEHVQAVTSGRADVLSTSATAATGLDVLRDAIVRALTGAEALHERVPISNLRHLSLLDDARMHLRAAHAAAASGDTPEEFLLVDLQAARARLDEVMGLRTSEDVLRHIFERFCIGK